MKDPKKVEAGKRLAAINRKKREAKKREEQAQLEKTASRVNQYYGIGAVKGPTTREVMMPVSQQPHPQAQPQTNKFEMD